MKTIKDILNTIEIFYIHKKLHDSVMCLPKDQYKKPECKTCNFIEECEAWQCGVR